MSGIIGKFYKYRERRYIKEAKTLFFSEAFKEEYLKDRREEKELYHQLLLGRNRNQIFGGIC